MIDILFSHHLPLFDFPDRVVDLYYIKRSFGSEGDR